MSFVPSVIDKDNGRERFFDIFSRLLKERVIFLTGPVRQDMASIIVAQLFHLEAEDNEKDITLYIDSPGGCVYSGLSIYNTMNFIKPDVRTVCTGMAMSMGAFLLSSGAKGKRICLPEATVMIHQVSSGSRGTAIDMQVSMDETIRLNKRLHEIIATNCGRDYDEVLEDCSRDKFMSAEDTLEYGLIDKIITDRSEV